MIKNEPCSLFTTLLTEEWQKALHRYSTVFVGFSGGLDSTVLLHNLASLPTLHEKLCAVHVHHGLSINAMAWQTHCEAYCKSLGIRLIVREVYFENRANIEEQAREARYQIFSTLLSKHDGLLLAHHADDQVETFLLQLLRGSGINGLAAMAQHKLFAKGEICRPLLECSRQTLEAYAKQYQLKWIEDESNQNIAFSRNYLRHQIIPLLKEKWPNAVNNIARSALHCQQAKANLDVLAKLDCTELNGAKQTLSIRELNTLQPARLINILRVWLAENDVRLPSTLIVNRIMNELIFARVDASPVVQWGAFMVRRYQQTLFLLKSVQQRPNTALKWLTFPDSLRLGSKDESNDYLLATTAAEGLKIPMNASLEVRFRQGGELLYWHGQTKQLKKLFQQWLVPPWLRDEIPLLYINNELAAVVGYAISDLYQGNNQDNELVYNVTLCSTDTVAGAT